jgi:hypothetical protein
LARCERDGAIAINSALAIRNCYRDLLAPGLARAGVPTPRGALIQTATGLDGAELGGIDFSAGVYVKRGDFHALLEGDVQRVASRAELEDALAGFARRGVRRAYVQNEFAGTVIKFYGVGDGAYFAALPEAGVIPPSVLDRLCAQASAAARALGLEAWGGDAVLSGDRFAVIDFNDWPSFSRVREHAARAIARRAIALHARAMAQQSIK